MVKETEYKLLTFYKFVDISNALEEVAKQKQFCRDIGMKGRIYIGEEGINAQITCNSGQELAYRLYLESTKYFKGIKDIDIKATIVDGHKFPKMTVKYRKEIVALGEIYNSSKIKESTFKISIEEFKKVIENNPDDYVILDMRNDYEYELGHFKTAIPAKTRAFREVLDKINDYKNEFGDKEIIMYCTGGIRCEKLGALLENSGLKGVRQLDGGVVKYVNTFNDGNWLGSLYTFDDRITTYVGDENTHTIIGKCYYSDEPSEEFFNCRYEPCKAHFIAKSDEYRKHFGFCSEECMENGLKTLQLRNVKWDKNNYKQIRGFLKQNPHLKEITFEKIQNDIKNKLKGVEFKYKIPWKNLYEKDNLG